MQSTIESATDLCSRFSKRNWISRALNYKTDDAAFEEIRKRLNEAINSLDLALASETLSLWKKAQSEDQQQMEKMIQKIDIMDEGIKETGDDVKVLLDLVRKIVIPGKLSNVLGTYIHSFHIHYSSE